METIESLDTKTGNAYSALQDAAQALQDARLSVRSSDAEIASLRAAYDAAHEAFMQAQALSFIAWHDAKAKEASE